MSILVRLEPGDDPKIHVTGSIIETMKRDHLKDLLHGPHDLEERLRKRHHGARPDGIHLSEDDGVPGNLKGTFDEYGWHEGRILITPGHTRIDKTSSNLVAVGSALCYNADDDSNLEATYLIDETVTQTIAHSSEWKVGASVTQTVTYQVGGEAAGGSVGGSTAISVSSEYGESASTSKEVSTASHGSGTVILEPGQRSIVVLSANRGALDAMVDYLHKIDGGVFYHFGKRIDGHFLWYVPFVTLYGEAGVMRQRKVKVSCDVYSNWSIGLEPGGSA